MNSIRVAVLAGAALGMSTAMWAKEVKIKQKDVPPAAVATAAKDYPKARITIWERETQDGKDFYEATLKEGSAQWQLLFDNQGAFVAREEDVSVSDVPTPVRDAVKNKYSKAQIRSAEKITRPAGVEFELGLKNAPKKVMVVGSSGAVLREE